MAIYLIILSPFIGSFLGLLVHRLPLDAPVFWGRSRCDHCAEPLAPQALIPIVSFLVQGGKSRCCGRSIPQRHLWIEILAVIVAVVCVATLPMSHSVLGVILGWGLLTLSFIDATVFRLPDVITLPLLVIGLAATAWYDPAAFPMHALAAILGWGLFILVKILYAQLRGRDGLGEGDAKLMAVGGAWLGAHAIGPILLLSGCAAILWIAIRMIGGKSVSLSTKLPYGVFLSIAIFSLWFAQP